jgi:hypothetical protein
MNSVITRHLLFVAALFGISMVPYTVMGSNDKVIIAIGGKAAIYPYPEGPILIYCVAPNIKLNNRNHAGSLVKIQTNPSVFVTISRYKELQPSLRRHHGHA